MELKDQLSALQAELKTHFEKAAEEKKEFGTMLGTTKASIEALQKQVDAIDVKLANRVIQDGTQGSTLEKEFKENESLQRLMRDKTGRAFISLNPKSAGELYERKTILGGDINIIATGQGVTLPTSGVLTIDRIPGIVPEARQILRVRDLFTARPTTMQVIDFVKVLSPLGIASPVPEASVKPENNLTFISSSERVKTIATWIPATKQILEDFQELLGFIRSSMPYYVNLEEELQFLSGDDIGEDLHGVIPQATAFNPALLSAVAGWNRIDVIGRAIQQITASKELDPTFVVLHPNDWWSIRLTKDGFGRYILGDPQMPSMGGTQNVVVRPNIFGLDVVSTTSMVPGTFLVGSGSTIACEIRDRMEMQVEISTEHASYFTSNLVAIRAEKRTCIVVKRPASYVSGSFSTSP
jgi:HK97 family phage major capsid protein